MIATSHLSGIAAPSLAGGGGGGGTTPFSSTRGGGGTSGSLSLRLLPIGIVCGGRGRGERDGEAENGDEASDRERLPFAAFG
eukprot:545790-Prymnesium_polylepis.2